MPNRVLNLDAFAAIAILLGLLGHYGRSFIARSALLLLVAGLSVRAILSQPPAFLQNGAWFRSAQKIGAGMETAVTPLRAMAWSLAAVLLAAGWRQMRNRFHSTPAALARIAMCVTLFSVLAAIVVRPGNYHRALLCGLSLIAGALWFGASALDRRWERARKGVSAESRADKPGRRGAGLRALVYRATLIVVIGDASVLWSRANSDRRERETTFRDCTNDSFFQIVSQQPGVLLTAGDLHLV